jgi:hypothetical protein
MKHRSSNPSIAKKNFFKRKKGKRVGKNLAMKGFVVLTCNPSAQETKAEDCEF